MKILNRYIKGFVTAGVVFLAAFLFLFLMAPDASAALVCTDCHNSPHGPDCSSDCLSCHTGKTFAHPSGAGTPSECSACHTNTPHPIVGAGTSLDAACVTSACHGTGGTAHRFTSLQLAPYGAVIHAGGSAPSTVCADCHTWEAAHLAHITGGANTPNYCKDCHQEPGTAIVAATACGRCHGGSAGVGGTINGAPYISAEGLAMYGSVMHGGAPEGGPVPPEPVLPPGPGCDSTLQASGTLTGGECVTDSSLLTNCTTSLGSASTLTGPFSNQAGNTHIYWGDGTALETNPASPVTHTYSLQGQYQIAQTVTNPCGNRSQKFYMVKVIGGTDGNGKGTLIIDAEGADGRDIAYEVSYGNGVNITHGSIMLDGSKSIILDPGIYIIEIFYSSIVPVTDPVQYHSCDALAGSSNILASDGVTVMGQRVSVTVTKNLTTTVSLTNCD